MSKKRLQTPKKGPISSADVLRAVLHFTETMAAKEDLAEIKVRMATTKHVEAIKDDVDVIGENIDTLNGEVRYIRGEMVTKADVRSIVDKAKEELLSEIRPIARAVDKDAVTLINYEKCITKIERHLIVK